MLALVFSATWIESEAEPKLGLLSLRSWTETVSVRIVLLLLSLAVISSS